jgi:hypothetical protein
MGDLKSVTVRYLRELARKHLGRGHGKLRTKAELLTALVMLVPALRKLVGKKGWGRRKGVVRPPEVSAMQQPDAPPRQRPALPGDDEEKTPVYLPPRPVEIVTFPPKPKPYQAPPPPEAPRPEAPRPETPPEPTSTLTPAPVPAAPELTPRPLGSRFPPQRAAEPLVEGFFVSRVAGEQEVQSHHLTQAQQAHPPSEAVGAPDPSESLGGLPPGYEDDTVLLLPRDPFSLFLFWDFNASTLTRAREGLDAPRSVLRVFNEESLVRVLEVPLEARGAYIQELPSGRYYRVEAWFVGRDGRTRRIGHSSNRAFLPAAGPSMDTSVRFMHMPAQPPPVTTTLAALAETAPTRMAPVARRKYISWRRTPLPSSAELQELSELEEEASPLQFLESTVQPAGAAEQPSWAHPLESSRGASSEQLVGGLPPGDVGGGPPGLLSWAHPLVEGRGASSEQRPQAAPPGGAPGTSSGPLSWAHPLSGARGASSEQLSQGQPPDVAGGVAPEQLSWAHPLSSVRGASSEQLSQGGLPGGARGASSEPLSWAHPLSSVQGASSEPLSWAHPLSSVRGASSEQLSWAHPLKSASEGSSEQRTWTPPPSGRGR